MFFWCAVFLALAGVGYLFFGDAGGDIQIEKQRKENHVKNKINSSVAANRKRTLEPLDCSIVSSPINGAVGIENAGTNNYCQVTSNTISQKQLPPPTYNNNSDELIAMAMSVAPDAEIPPLPFDAAAEIQFKKSLDKPIEIRDTDSDDVVRMKNTVMETRSQIAELFKQGMTLKEIITEHRELFNANVKVRNECIAELNEIFESGDIQGARKYMTTINFALQQMGIEEIEMPLTLAERIERAKAIKLQREQQGKEKSP